MSDIYSRSPINKTAAIVTSKSPNSEVTSRWYKNGDSQTFLPLRDLGSIYLISFENLTGVRFGRLTVVGMSLHYNARWSCRCDCGWYVLRKSKSIKNPKNTQDRCYQCRNIAFLKRDHERRTTGRDVDINKF